MAETLSFTADLRASYCTSSRKRLRFAPKDSMDGNARHLSPGASLTITGGAVGETTSKRRHANRDGRTVKQRSLSCPPPDKTGSQSGFTLIEISIVLVIIGLIVGGALVGQTLIASASLRAQVTQFEKFNQAANTFRVKYDCLPGDCANATTFFPSLGWPWTNGDGNGNFTGDNLGNTSDYSGFPGSVMNEPTLFWVHLWEAGLTDCCDPTSIGISNYIIGTTFPQDKINGGAIGIGTLGWINGYFWGITNSCVGACGQNAWNYGALSKPSTGVLTAAQAQAFDAKIDDGLATSGNVYTAWLYGGDDRVHPYTYHSGYNCTTNTSPPAYNVAYGSPACDLWINMQGGQ